ncbi:MAG: hypothetical protein MJ075_06650 [Oscillospiraceae bacterium]|nr:hypothetical protein [Oscillospiraceae bacterium]
MKKAASLPVWLSGLAGIIGAVVHRLHVSRCYDDLGYILAGQPLTALLIGISLLSALLALVWSLVFTSRRSEKASYTELFSPVHGALYFICGLLAALLLLAFGILHFLILSYPSRIDYLVCLLAMLAAVCLFLLTLKTYTRRVSPSLAYLAALIAVFFCLWMILHFIGNNRNPVILSFCLECVAFGSAAMFLLGMGSAALGAVQHFTTVFFGLLTISFSFIALTGQQIDTADRLLLAAAVLMTAPPLLCCLRKAPEKK